MARTNVKGSSFGGLDLDKDEDKKLRKYVKQNDTDLKKILRDLVRTHIIPLCK